ncbi:hypothetical protein G6F40_011499 [Rhizopus arrhizus]|nr:hypothetical protein G6F40_011499 [Rhizopus arrhizus]
MSTHLQTIQRLQNELAIANAKIHQLQQENVSLRKQVSSEPTPTANSNPPSESTPPPPNVHAPPAMMLLLPLLYPHNYGKDRDIQKFLSHILILGKTPTTKVSKLPNPKPKHSLAAIARQFSSPTAPSSFKFIHVPIHRRLPIHQLRANLRELHINARRILDIQYSDRNVGSFLIHTCFESELRSQLYKHKITIRDEFDPLSPSISHDPALLNESIERKTKLARHVFLQRLGSAFRRLKAPLYNAVTNYFLQSGLIDLNFLKSFDLAPPLLDRI